MHAACASTVEALIGEPVSSFRAVGGGSIARSYCVERPSGGRLFVKDYGDAPSALARAEAEGLRWLAHSGDLRVAEVVAVSDERPVLVLGYIESAPARDDFAERLGGGLAALHARGAEVFGHPHDNFIGSLPQQNAPRPTWARFYAEQRIEPLLRRAVDDGRLPPDTVRRAHPLLDDMEARCGPVEPPARLHGDLWSGNLMVDERGEPCLVDPAVYGGHREMDLAMMQLFGGFPARTFDAYRAACPLAPGHEDRVRLYQLHPLLVHAVLFGGHYAQSCLDTISQYA